MDNLYKALEETTRLINLVDDPQVHLVLQMRYRNFKKWEQIAAELGYSWRQVHRLHDKGLNVILKLDNKLL